MNNVLMRKIDVTGDYAPLAASTTVASVTISCLPANSGTVYFKGDDGSDVPWVPGEWHAFQSVDLAEIRVKGTPGDAVLVVGGTWVGNVSMGHAASSRDAAGEIARPQDDLATSGAGWVTAAIPSGAMCLYLFLDVAAYVVWDELAADPAANGDPLQPGLNFRVACRGATHLHIKRVGGSDVTCKWKAVLRV